jgi:hypothetical protein
MKNFIRNFKKKIMIRKEMHILVVGYYYHNNLGDESYREVIGTFFPGDYLDFVDVDKLEYVNSNNYNAVIVGGGDVINDYFLQKIVPFLKKFLGIKMAFSIGFPFKDLIKEEYIGCFDHIFTRNRKDIRRAQKVLGSHKVHYLPDATFKLPINKDIKVRKEPKRCGMFMVGNLIRYNDIVEDLIKLVNIVSRDYQVTLYCFDSDEDYLLSQKIVDGARETAINLGYYDESSVTNQIQFDGRQYTTYEMLDVISKLDFAVCMRYHAHIFAMITGVPYLSISSTRKTKLLMTQAQLEEFQYEIPLDGYFNPIRIDYAELEEIYNYSEEYKSLFINKGNKFVEHAKFLLDTDQPYRIIHNIGDRSEESINRKVLTLVNETKDYVNGARLISSHILGYPDSPYVWGMSEKISLAHSNDSLDKLINSSKKYLTEHGKILDYKDANRSLSHQLKCSKTLPINVDMNQYMIYKDVHRGGWYLAIEKLNELSSYNGIILDMYVDRTFHWARNYMIYEGLVPYTSPWAGFIHHTLDTTYSENNTTRLFEIKEFVQSLDTCIALFTLSETLSQFIRDKLVDIAPHVRVVTFTHPTVIPSDKFSVPKFENNPDKMLVNIGAWLRNPFSIYLVESNFPIKTVLIGKQMEGYLPPTSLDIKPNSERPTDNSNTLITSLLLAPCRPTNAKWIIYYVKYLQDQGVNVTGYDSNTIYVANNTDIPKLKAQLAQLIHNVKVIKHVNNEEYDDLLAKNIIFINLVDAAAVNTIIECIVRSTPIVVNKLPAVIDILGPNYPLLYDDISELPGLLTYENISRAHRYLRNLDTDIYSLNYFIEQVSDVVANY